MKPLAAALSLAALLGACSPSAPPAVAPPLAPPAASIPASSSSAPPPKVARAPEPPAPCLPATAAEAEIFSSSLAGSTLTVCMRTADEPGEGEGFPCIALDLKTRKLASAPAISREFTPPEPARGPSLLSTTATELKVCSAPGACKTIQVAPKKTPAGGHGDSDDSTLIAALSPDARQVAVLVQALPRAGAHTGDVFVDLYSVDKGKRTAHIKAPLFQDHSDNWGVSWLDGNTLHLSTHRCCGPDGAEALLDLRKNAFENIGDPALLRQIKPGVWLQGNGDRFDTSASAAVQLTFLHLDSGKRARLRLPARPNKEPEGHELEAHPIDATTWAVVHTTPPGVAWINVEQETLSDQLNLPLCK